jgi:hypothetical protein
MIAKLRGHDPVHETLELGAIAQSARGWCCGGRDLGCRSRDGPSRAYSSRRFLLTGDGPNDGEQRESAQQGAIPHEFSGRNDRPYA